MYAKPINMKNILLLSFFILISGLVTDILAQRTPVPATNGNNKTTTNKNTTVNKTPATKTTTNTGVKTNNGTTSRNMPKIPTKTSSTAIGIRLGGGIMGGELGLSLQQRLNTNNYLEAIVGLNKYDYRLTGFYQYHYPLAVKGLNLYGGVGAHVGKTRSGGIADIIDIINGDVPDVSGPGIFTGVDAIGGLMYKLPGMPINLSLDVKPAYSFNNHPKPFEIGAGLTVRWTFGSGGGGGNGSGNGNGNGNGTNGGNGGGSGNGNGNNTGTQTKDGKVKPYPNGNTNNGTNTNTNPTNNTNNGGGGRGNTTNPTNNTNNNNGGSGGGNGNGGGGGNSNGETYDDGGQP